MARRSAARTAARLRGLQGRRAVTMGRRLRGFFRGQATRVVNRYLESEGVKVADVLELKQATAPAIFPADEDGRLFRIVQPFVLAQLDDSGQVAAELLAVEPLLRTDPRLQALLGRSGSRIRGISELTRQAVARELQAGSAAGLSPFQIANGNREAGVRGIRSVVRETYRNRALTIARTELAIASQQAAHDRYDAADVIELEISDGPECGWTHHTDPDLANGSIRQLQDVEAYPIAHPNCLRVSLPVLP